MPLLVELLLVVLLLVIVVLWVFVGFLDDIVY
jgi:hypothetical protein